ncbi:MAG: DinB family protein [Leptolyngbya sp. PLA1]|nr:DinB family protein [Leptolyngbya sp. PLA1]
MRRQDLLAESVLMSKPLVLRFLPGFDDSNATRQAPNLPNHAVWSLGHLALTMHRVAEKLDGVPLPGDTFAPGPAGDARRFATESVSFNSEPADTPANYPPLARAVEIFEKACDRLAAAARHATDAVLDAPTPWGATTVPVWTLVLRMSFHNGIHTGQLTDLRRSLGFKRVLS